MNVIDRNHLLTWLESAPLHAVLVDTRGYQHRPEHRWLNDVQGAMGFHEQLVSKRVSEGRLYAADVRFLAVKFPAAAVAVYVKRDSARQSPVLIYADTLVGLPSKGDGGDIIVPFSTGVLGINI